MQTVFVSLLHQILNVFICDTVIDLLTLTPGGHKAQVAQDAQLMRGGTGTEPTLSRKIIDVGLASKQDRQQAQTGWIGETLEGGCHAVEIRVNCEGRFHITSTYMNKCSDVHNTT